MQETGGGERLYAPGYCCGACNQYGRSAFAGQSGQDGRSGAAPHRDTIETPRRMRVPQYGPLIAVSLAISMPSRYLKSATMGIEPPQPISTASLPHSWLSASCALASWGGFQSSEISA